MPRDAPPKLGAPIHPPRLLEALLAAGPLVAGALLLGVLALLWGAYRVLDPTPDKHLVIATGPEQGAYVEFARAYAPLLQQHGLTLELRASQGSRQNLQWLRDPASGVHAAFVQGGVEGAGDDAAGDRRPLLSLGSVAPEPLWLFYRAARAGAEPPVRLAQLAGWRIHTGPPGGGTGALFQRLARDSGLALQPLALDERATVHAVVALVQGEVDALAMVSAADAPLVQYLLATPGIVLFDFAQSEAYARRFGFLRPLVLPRGVVDLARDQPGSDVRLVAATASLVVRADLHPALQQLLVQAAQQVHGGAGWFARPREYPNPAAAEFVLADEAARHYRNGPPWLQRHLPFWLANFIDRMWIVLLPLLAVALPLSRILPPLVTLRLRSRVFRWYAHLRALEAEIERAGSDRAALRLQLEQLDQQTENIGVPLSYAHELYDLRQHIHGVRKRLQQQDAVEPRRAGPGRAAPGPLSPPPA
ncbi:MAG: C4-dicarboxylate ABC transporter substrate-binding protein [Rubrivivax sp.]|nr:C4-dicarboxylate ABC transporter substrate-binding protein [Rubrivivax sp.]